MNSSEQESVVPQTPRPTSTTPERVLDVAVDVFPDVWWAIDTGSSSDETPYSLPTLAGDPQ
jgi:hypothetical protein